MQVAFYLAEEITQVKEAIPWVRCASGNVLDIPLMRNYCNALVKRWNGQKPQYQESKVIFEVLSNDVFSEIGATWLK